MRIVSLTLKGYGSPWGAEPPDPITYPLPDPVLTPGNGKRPVAMESVRTSEDNILHIRDYGVLDGIGHKKRKKS